MSDSKASWFAETAPGGLDQRKACYRQRLALKICILETDCCRIERKTPKDCYKEGKAPECTQEYQAFYECKRSILDMRTRFRGIKDT